MMILTVGNTAALGNPVKVFDAHGREIDKCVKANTETGEIERFAYDGDAPMLNADKTQIVRIREVWPAPLTVEWLHGK